MSAFAISADWPPASDTVLRDQLSSLRGLLMLSMLMTASGDERQILHLATTSVPSFGHCHVEGVYLVDGQWQETVPSPTRAEVRAALEAQLKTLGRTGGQVTIPGEAWGWALPLRSLAGDLGYLVVAADDEPPPAEQFLLQALAQQAGVALANARLHAKERATAEELRAANAALAETVRALERAIRIHDRFTRVVVAGEGQEGIATALHELTGFPVAVEDRYGNLRAWAGPNRPEPYPKDPPARREQMMRRALREGRPIREGGRLLAVANPRDDVLGVLALVDPARAAGEQEQIALEYGATVLAMELARLRSMAETELRLRRDLVEELLSGTDEESALARAHALGYDLERRHRVIVVEGRARIQDRDVFFHAVRRAARTTGVGSLLVARGDTVVVLSDTDVPWERFRTAVLTELGGGRCRLGIGGPCDRPAEFPRSYREALLALKMQRTARGNDRAISYEDLGVYRILGEVNDPAAVERFVRQWLGALLDYDERKHSELVTTLSQYLESGGNYDATAAALAVHRSTLKYRLQRIREISGHDLADPDTRFNLQLATRAWRTLHALRS
ncbi:CdaR family transcriptional regulator [Carbonactinospora thermoautotrophica]|uniref:Transcriptional regulator n=1 Tax=Carbonactinospora thermoautotrophica TaxID=1469144 RepID=A0A132MT35_9ACTN|nr:helix-turn-helix domain-containing protein [Carbonactinospora thermoautotrophica]KWX01058.1 Transcriptional regulator [Carbonactinospora thermoautotrophica]KWX04730.1 CdaR family transcriptional regulator [Carbonactinospora thermoautotrophica]KWX09366.1 CdaR family transcriptional regulator [Carbonactinospora thermoautotrophica]